MRAGVARRRHRQRPASSIEVDGDRITAVRPGVGEPPSTATRLAGLTLPGLANAHSHAFHRVLRGATQIGVGSFWTWREQMYAAAERLDAGVVPPARHGRVRRDGARRHHVRRRVPLPPPRTWWGAVRRPERDGCGAGRRRRDGRHSHHAARHVLPARWHRRRAGPDPAALRRRRRARVGGPRRRASTA